MDQLKILFDALIVPPNERCGLVWEESAQPETVVEMAEQMFPALKPVPSLDIEGLEDSPVHYIIEGDNYHTLSALTITHAQRVDVIYIDPPYNTGNPHLTYHDNRKDKSSASRHSKWLNFMYHRLRLAQELLTDDGVLLISIDDREMAHLKLLCDGLFGSDNFIGNFVWINRTTPNDAANKFATDHEYILVYARDRKNFQLKGVPKNFSKYVNRDNDSNGPWMPDNPSAASGTEKDRFPIKNPHTGEVYYPPDGRYWAFAKRRVKEWEKSGKLVFPQEKGKRFVLKKYLSELKSARNPASSIVNNALTSHGTKELKQLFGSGSPIKYPKPSVLLKYILGLLDKQNGIFLDFFAGSGTTGQAILELNQEDGGTRQCILCNNNESDLCRNVLHPRLQKISEGYSVEAPRKETLYERKLTVNTLKKVSAYLQEITALSEQYRNSYDEVKQSLKDNVLRLEGVRKKPVTVAGMQASFKYFQTQFIPPQDTRIRQACAHLLCLREQTFEPINITLHYQAYRNQQQVTVICFEPPSAWKSLEAVLPKDASLVIYVFREEDYALTKDHFPEATVQYVPDKIKRLFTS
ncbi:site-specific DNA-methyltransferase [Tunicatimonas pelagia]|uniref:site-specific DNA-methyltransferase n=1 Tax=Tunicatimonas pelagia TaxID=931531 RepID=UPI002666B8D7|nr:site-specific DNA-methyltransferase [Tunicatimonas pelagia]WKN41040.1 site-specific DNA-methyltransferase [Tunicatimonas pelagia]